MLVRLAVLALPVIGAAHVPLDLPAWSVTPFVLMLLAFSVLPLAAGHFWHSNRNRALVTAVITVPAAVYLVYVQLATGQQTIPLLLHELGQYASFIALLGSLYTVSGGIVLRGSFPPRPLTNTAFLALGAVL